MRDGYQSRAKQFLPYASLRGFEKIVAEKRKIKEPRRQLAEDAEEELSRTLSELTRGTTVRLSYYSDGRYTEKSGEFLFVDTLSRELVLEGERIPLYDLFSIEIN